MDRGRCLLAHLRAPLPVPSPLAPRYYAVGRRYLGQELREQGDEVLGELHLIIGLGLPFFGG